MFKVFKKDINTYVADITFGVTIMNFEQISFQQLIKCSKSTIKISD